jgi:electron transfer flavoprotein beta subunit
MKAKKKPLDVVPLAELDTGEAKDLQIGRFAPPPVRSRGIRVEDAAALVAELKNRGLV